MRAAMHERVGEKKKINLYGSRRTGAEGHRESPTRKSRGWDEPKMEKARGVDGDRHVVTRDRVLIKSEDISPDPA